jgi:Family of unknown function (DUF5681)
MAGPNMKQTDKSTADTTGGKQQIGRPFKPGQSGNPAGRPKGSRNKLSEAFIKALADDFSEHGVAVIQQVRSERPQDYLKIVAALQPKQVELDAPVRYVARLPEPAQTVEQWQAMVAIRTNGRSPTG